MPDPRHRQMLVQLVEHFCGGDGGHSEAAAARTRRQPEGGVRTGAFA
jgi:hypothetical protein